MLRSENTTLMSYACLLFSSLAICTSKPIVSFLSYLKGLCFLIVSCNVKSIETEICSVKVLI